MYNFENGREEEEYGCSVARSLGEKNVSIEKIGYIANEISNCLEGNTIYEDEYFFNILNHDEKRNFVENLIKYHEAVINKGSSFPEYFALTLCAMIYEMRCGELPRVSEKQIEYIYTSFKDFISKENLYWQFYDCNETPSWILKEIYLMGNLDNESWYYLAINSNTPKEVLLELMENEGNDVRWWKDLGFNTIGDLAAANLSDTLF